MDVSLRIPKKDDTVGEFPFTIKTILKAKSILLRKYTATFYVLNYVEVFLILI